MIDFIRSPGKKASSRNWFNFGRSSFDSVMFVLPNPQSSLVKLLQKHEEQNNQGRSSRIKIVEQAGKSLKNILAPNIIIIIVYFHSQFGTDHNMICTMRMRCEGEKLGSQEKKLPPPLNIPPHQVTQKKSIIVIISSVEKSATSIYSLLAMMSSRTAFILHISSAGTGKY